MESAKSLTWYDEVHNWDWDETLFERNEFAARWALKTSCCMWGWLDKSCL